MFEYYTSVFRKFYKMISYCKEHNVKNCKKCSGVKQQKNLIFLKNHSNSNNNNNNKGKPIIIKHNSSFSSLNSVSSYNTANSSNSTNKRVEKSNNYTKSVSNVSTNVPIQSSFPTNVPDYVFVPEVPPVLLVTPPTEVVPEVPTEVTPEVPTELPIDLPTELPTDLPTELPIEVVPEVVPTEIVPEVVPAEVVPTEIVPEVVPAEVVPTEVVPTEVVPEVVPEVAPEVVPAEVVPEVAPEVDDELEINSLLDIVMKTPNIIRTTSFFWSEFEQKNTSNQKTQYITFENTLDTNWPSIIQPGYNNTTTIIIPENGYYLITYKLNVTSISKTNTCATVLLQNKSQISSSQVIFETHKPRQNITNSVMVSLNEGDNISLLLLSKNTETYIDVPENYTPNSEGDNSIVPTETSALITFTKLY